VKSGARVFGVIVCSLLAACQVSEAKIHNLDELHDAESRHRYNAALEGDFEFVMRHKVLGALNFSGTRLTAKNKAEVEAPADACLENLIELAEIETTDPGVFGRQIEWFARLAVEDPWSLSRERAITALAKADLDTAALYSRLADSRRPRAGRGKRERPRQGHARRARSQGQRRRPRGRV
jgi:hypothetical protein